MSRSLDRSLGASRQYLPLGTNGATTASLQASLGPSCQYLPLSTNGATTASLQPSPLIALARSGTHPLPVAFKEPDLHSSVMSRTVEPELSYTSMRQLGMHQLVPYQSPATASTVRSGDAPFSGRPTHPKHTQLPQVASYPSGFGTHHAPFTHTPTTTVDPGVRDAAGRKPNRKQWGPRSDITQQTHEPGRVVHLPPRESPRYGRGESRAEVHDGQRPESCCWSWGGPVGDGHLRRGLASITDDTVVSVDVFLPLSGVIVCAIHSAE